MRKMVKAGLFSALIFLSVDSFGLASLAHTWLSTQFPQLDSHPSLELASLSVKKEIQRGSSLSDLFDYRSFRRIQTSA